MAMESALCFTPSIFLAPNLDVSKKRSLLPATPSPVQSNCPNYRSLQGTVPSFLRFSLKAKKSGKKPLAPVHTTPEQVDGFW